MYKIIRILIDNIRKVSTILIIPIIIIVISGGCEETKRYEIAGGDNTPPAPPVFIDSKPLLGGARVFFRPPTDEDLLTVEVAYIGAAGNNVRFAASYFTDSLDVYGFGREGEHAIELYALDRAGNRSTSIRETVVSLEPPVVSVAKTVEVFPSFASILLKWTDLLHEPFYVSADFSYTWNGARHNYTRTFASYQSETRSIDSVKLYNDEPVSVKISVRDKFGNISAAKDTTIVLLTDGVIDKRKWTLPASGTVIGGIAQANGNNMNMVIDNLVELPDNPFNYFITTETNPWNIIIDLGDEYQLSRILTHQRWSGYNATANLQGNLYRGENVLSYRLYGWDDINQSWDLFSGCTILPPVVNDTPEYTTLGMTGDKFFLYPEEPQFSKPTRLVRLEAVNGKYISEITLYGRTVR